MTEFAPPEWPGPNGRPSEVRVVEAARSRYKSLPLWAKVALPVAAIGALGAAVGGSDNKNASTRSLAASPVGSDTASTVETTVAEATSPTSSVSLPTSTAPSTTAPSTTAPSTTVAIVTTTATKVATVATVALVSPPATSGLAPQFDSCKKAKARGYGPYYNGIDPEYGWYRDADHDGIVCE